MANTTSGSYVFDKNLSIDEIIEDAYERIGIQGTSGYQLKTAKRSLNILSQGTKPLDVPFVPLMWEPEDLKFVTSKPSPPANLDLRASCQAPSKMPSIESSNVFK